MPDHKNQKKAVDDYEYLTNTASAMECTGLIPSLPRSGEELESYNDVYRFYPPDYPQKDPSGEDPQQ